jgi:hypothetical protein
MNNSVEFKKIKWGALTKQLKEFNAKNNINFNLEQFSNYILENPHKFKTTTEKRALFYNNVLKGGKVSIGNIKSFIDNSYSKNPKENIDGYVIDKALSNDIAKVYYNPQTGHATITHRGTEGLKDWGNNLAYLTGMYDYTDRYKRGKKAQEAVEKKYGKKNVSTLGHSQGAILSRKLGADTKEIINLNPAYVAEKPKKNEYNIKSSSDIVSKLKPIHKRDIEIKAETSNPLTEHSSDILNRLDLNREVGAGISGGKKFNFLNSIIKVGKTLGKPFEKEVGINPFTMGYDLGEKVIAPALMKVIPPKKGSGMNGLLVNQILKKYNKDDLNKILKLLFNIKYTKKELSQFSDDSFADFIIEKVINKNDMFEKRIITYLKDMVGGGIKVCECKGETLCGGIKMITK